MAAKKRARPSSTTHDPDPRALAGVRPSVREACEGLFSSRGVDGGIFEAVEALAALARQVRVSDGRRERARRDRALLIVNAAVDAVRLPNPSRDEWLAEVVDSMHRELSTSERRALVVGALRDDREDLEELRYSLERADEAFAKLPDAKLRTVLAKVREVPKGGAGHWGVYTAAAALSLEVNAFGDERRGGKRKETVGATLERLAKLFERASKRSQR